MSLLSDFNLDIDVETFASIIDAMYDEVLIYDHNYRIVYINRACSRHYGCPPEEMIGKKFSDFTNLKWWGPSILPIVYRDKKAYAIKQKTYLGSELHTIAVPVFDSRNVLRYVVMNVRDTVRDIELYNPHYISSRPESSPSVFPCKSQEMRPVMALAERYSAMDVPCILYGELGVGKSQLAKYIHSIGPRKKLPFITLKCTRVSSDDLEAALFGSRAPARPGQPEAVAAGTLYMDEVSELSLDAQAMLYAYLQERELSPSTIPTDLRILASTQKNLRQLAEAGLFREELYYRLSVAEIYVPPLRKRPADITELINTYLDFFNKRYGVKRELSSRAIGVLLLHHWPGNLSELKHLVESLVVSMDHTVIDVGDLPKNVFSVDNDRQPPELGGKTFDALMEQYEALLVRDAYNRCHSSRKVAEYLSISQTRANNLIRKHIEKTPFE